MTGRLAEVEARIGTVHKLASVISAMRGIAAARVQEAQRHAEGIRTYADTIGAAIGEAMPLLPDRDPPPRGTGADGREGRRTVALLEDLYRSSREGRPVDCRRSSDD